MLRNDLLASLKLTLAASVLPPWPSAIAMVQAFLNKRSWLSGVRTVIDMGCGSGLLALAAHRLGDIESCVMVDVNRAAVGSAVANAARNGLSATGVVSDVWRSVPPMEADLIISNPPFQNSPEGDRNLVDPGLSMHRRLFAEGKRFLSPGGRLVVMTCPAITRSREPEQIALAAGWQITDRCTLSIPAPSARHPNRVHEYSAILLQ